MKGRIKKRRTRARRKTVRRSAPRRRGGARLGAADLLLILCLLALFGAAALLLYLHYAKGLNF